jgi:acyl-coenzyme A thioesterase PaaI-like protein
MQVFQDFYPEDTAVCYGCGYLNPHGLQIKTVWEGDESVTQFRPKPEHTAIAGFVYGGLIASLIDCHSTGTAMAALYRAENRPMGSEPPFRCVTGSLHVDYLAPTPIDALLTIRGRVVEIKGRKVVVDSSLLADGVETARGRVVAISIGADFGKRGA